MPQYTTREGGPEYFSGQELRKPLKGKSCYHITEVKFDDIVEAQLKEALDKGLGSYKKLGWIK